jgi:hypothetical protein
MLIYFLKINKKDYFKILKKIIFKNKKIKNKIII